MKTLLIRSGQRLTIRAIAQASSDGGRDRCHTLAFLQAQKIEHPKDLIEITALLTAMAERGVIHDQTKFKKLAGTELFEFKTWKIRLICFQDTMGLIVCTHGYIKDGEAAPKSELKKANNLRDRYFSAKKDNTLIHGK